MSSAAGDAKQRAFVIMALRRNTPKISKQTAEPQSRFSKILNILEEHGQHLASLPERRAHDDRSRL